MKNKIIRYAQCLSFLLLLSCSLHNHSFNPDSAWVEKKGKYTFILSPLSSQALAAINYSGSDLSETAKDSAAREYDQFLCFIMEIRIDDFNKELALFDGGGKKADAETKAGYYQLGMQQSLKLLSENGEQTPCTIFYAEQLQSVTGSNRFVIGFSRKAENYTGLSYNNPYLDAGTIQFHFNNPQLAIN